MTLKKFLKVEYNFTDDQIKEIIFYLKNKYVLDDITYTYELYDLVNEAAYSLKIIVD